MGFWKASPSPGQKQGQLGHTELSGAQPTTFLMPKVYAAYRHTDYRSINGGLFFISSMLNDIELNVFYTILSSLILPACRSLRLQAP